MRRALLLLTAVIALVSCEKKSTSNRKNFSCVKNDSLYSNIPVLNNQHFKVIAVNYDQVNEQYLNFLVKENTKMDTLYFKHDTLELEFWTMACTQIE